MSNKSFSWSKSKGPLWQIFTIVVWRDVWARKKSERGDQVHCPVPSAEWTGHRPSIFFIPPPPLPRPILYQFPLYISLLDGWKTKDICWPQVWIEGAKQKKQNEGGEERKGRNYEKHCIKKEKWKWMQGPRIVQIAENCRVTDKSENKMTVED